jgi:U4/U6 small nuclear ribonucleoprotein PRP31
MSFSWFEAGQDAAKATGATASATGAATAAATGAPSANAAGAMLRYTTVDQVSTYRSSDELGDVLKQLQLYADTPPASNVMLRSDPEYAFIINCGNVCVRIEHEKLRIHRFIVDHYSRRFPELAALVGDANTYARVVRLIGNAVHDMDAVIEPLEALVPSQLLVAVIAASCTTRGEELPPADLEHVAEACDELAKLEEVKQVLLEYIQERMILVCRNLCAYLGSGIASQLVATAGSVDALAAMDTADLQTLGSARGQNIGFAVRTAGFLQNVDLVQRQPAELRTRALRLVAEKVISLARIDANREGADESEGLRARDWTIRRILEWSDPLIQQEQRKRYGASNKLYEKRSRVKRGDRWAAAGQQAAGGGGGGGAPRDDGLRFGGVRRERE